MSIFMLKILSWHVFKHIWVLKVIAQESEVRGNFRRNVMDSGTEAQEGQAKDSDE